MCQALAVFEIDVAPNGGDGRTQRDSLEGDDDDVADHNTPSTEADADPDADCTAIASESPSLGSVGASAFMTEVESAPHVHGRPV